jgi:hypothetical protein
MTTYSRDYYLAFSDTATALYWQIWRHAAPKFNGDYTETM